MDGNATLRELLSATPYGSLAQAVAALSRFAHPVTVAQTGNHALFRVVRSTASRGAIVDVGGGRRLMYDDNSTPTLAFLWAHGLARSGRRAARDVQYNHVYDRVSRFTDNADVYTSLANLCVTPAFLSKLTDHDEEVVALLRYRVYDLHGYAPTGEVPARPPGYGSLAWADAMPPVHDLEARLREGLTANPASPIARSAREIGWYFSGWRPDPSVPAATPRKLAAGDDHGA